MSDEMSPEQIEDTRHQVAEWIKRQWEKRRPTAYQRMKAEGTLDEVALMTGDELEETHNELLRSGLKEPEAYLQARRDVVAIPDDE